MSLSLRTLALVALVAALTAGSVVWLTAGSGAAPPAQAAPTPSATNGGITVNGEGTVSAVPDRSQWSFGVATSARDANTAWNAAAKKAQSIVAALKSAGVADKDIQTSSISLSPDYGRSQSQITGYGASMTVTVTISVKDSSRVVNAATSAGANNVDGPSLSIADSEGYYQQALALAIAQAKARAEAAAKAAGVTLGQPTSIDTTANGPVVFSAAAVPAAGKAAAVPVEAGQQQVTADVTVTYAIG